MAGSSDGQWVWYQLPGGQESRVTLPKDAIIDDLKKALFPNARPADIGNITIKTSMDDKALDPRDDIQTVIDSSPGIGNGRTPLFVECKPPQAATSSQAQVKKKFRVVQEELHGVPFVEGRILPKTIHRLAVKTEDDFNQKMNRHGFLQVCCTQTGDDLTYDEIQDEDVNTWRRSDENIKYFAKLDIGLLNSDYASHGVHGYHDALEAEIGETIESNGVKMASEHCYHEAHRFQVWLQSPHDQQLRERDGLAMTERWLALVSVKSRFGSNEFEELLADINLGNLPGNQRPVMNMQDWKIRDSAKQLVPVLDIYRKYFPTATRTQLPLLGYACSPVFTPGLWQKRMLTMSAVRAYQRVSLKWVKFKK
mmetsp:Transcript_54800/g.130698  ORF Transcript_54800/g.130698 Transcript_54800/m.130698 type:complete len:366 (-) Transcript_54800:45-1142(-)